MDNVKQATNTPANVDWEEIVLFVGENAEHYQQKFRRLYDNGGKFVMQWHWAAFVVNVPWFIFRKMHLWAAAYFLILLATPFSWYLLLIVVLLPGFLGHYLYYRHVLSKIRKITSTGEQRRADIIRAGGTNSIPLTVGISLLGIALISVLVYKLYVAPVVNDVAQEFAGELAFISDTDDLTTRATKLKMLLLENMLALQEKVDTKEQPAFQKPVNIKDVMRILGDIPTGDRDFWGTSMVFEQEGKYMAFRSAGPDRIFDTPDDIELRAPVNRPPL